MHVNDERYNEILSDPRNGIETIYTSWTGTIITATTASISSLSSVIIVFLIMRSSTGLSSPYHRIMFGLSIAVFISMLPVAFTTLLMPKDMIYDQFEGIVAGTTATCNAQGFCYVLGLQMTAFYNAWLCIYYLSSIRYKMSDDRFFKIERFLHALAIIFPATVSIFLITRNMINPAPWGTWCAAYSLPWWCHDDECSLQHLNRTGRVIYKALFTLVSGTMFVVIITSFTLIVWSVYSDEKMLIASSSKDTGSKHVGDELKERRRTVFMKDLEHTKTALKQTAAYTMSYVAVFALLFLRSFSNDYSSFFVTNESMQILYLVLRPLQGFFNLIIFLYHKVYNMRCANRAYITTGEALQRVFFGNFDDAEYAVSRLTIVKRHSMENRLEYAFVCEGDENEEEDGESGTVGKAKAEEGPAPFYTCAPESIHFGSEKSNALSSPVRSTAHQDLSGFDNSSMGFSSSRCLTVDDGNPGPSDDDSFPPSPSTKHEEDSH